MVSTEPGRGHRAVGCCKAGRHLLTSNMLVFTHGSMLLAVHRVLPQVINTVFWILQFAQARAPRDSHSSVCTQIEFRYGPIARDCTRVETGIYHNKRAADAHLHRRSSPRTSTIMFSSTRSHRLQASTTSATTNAAAPATRGEPGALAPAERFCIPLAAKRHCN